VKEAVIVYFEAFCQLCLERNEENHGIVTHYCELGKRFEPRTYGKVNKGANRYTASFYLALCWPVQLLQTAIYISSSVYICDIFAVAIN
jgi:hypothetical protein